MREIHWIGEMAMSEREKEKRGKSGGSGGGEEDIYQLNKRGEKVQEYAPQLSLPCKLL